jgi:hypothetical protein
MKTKWRVRSLLPVLLLAVSFGCNTCSQAPQPTTSATIQAEQSIVHPLVPLPNAKDSFKFVVIGDFGTGAPPQLQLAAEMDRFRQTWPYETVITVGDNLYGRQRAIDFKKKFEDPYKPLLDAGVKFYASLGNHDIREQPSYKLFNMNGQYYYTMKAPTQSVRFFMLDSNYMTPEQRDWMDKEMKGSGEDWKIAVFHHPLYSSGGRHGSDLKLREIMEPVFVQDNVSVVFSGHDHFYERIRPQHGIVYYVVGSGGQLARGDIQKTTGLTDKGDDGANVFLAVEILGDKMYFNAVETGGGVIDSGIIERRMPVGTKPKPAVAAAATQTQASSQP